MSTTNDDAWCSLGRGNDPFMKKAFLIGLESQGDSRPSESATVIIPTFTEEDFQAHLTVFRNTNRSDGLEAPELACALYYFTNRCVVQDYHVTSSDRDAILASIKSITSHYSTLDKSYFITRILLDMLEQDIYVVHRPGFGEVLTILLDQAHLTDVPIEKCCRTVVVGIRLLVTLVNSVLVYGGCGEDPEIADFPWPTLDFDGPVRPKTTTGSIEFLFDNEVFCDGLVHLLMFGVAVFEKSFDKTDLFHWDLALIATIIKTRVLKHEALEKCFTHKVLVQLFRASCSYMYDAVAAGSNAVEAILGTAGSECGLGGQIHWKRVVIATIGLLIAGNPTEMHGVCVFPDSAARFPDILRTLTSRFGSLKAARLACRDFAATHAAHGRTSLYDPRAAPPQQRPGAPTQPSPSPPPSRVEDGHSSEAKVEERGGVTDLEREKFWKDMMESEARDAAARQRTAASSNTTTAKKKKKKSKSKTNKTEAVAVSNKPAEEVGDDNDDDDDDDDDASSLRRLSKMKNMKLRPQQTVLPTLSVDVEATPAPTKPAAVKVLKKGTINVLPVTSSPKKTITATTTTTKKRAVRAPEAVPVAEEPVRAPEVVPVAEEPVRVAEDAVYAPEDMVVPVAAQAMLVKWLRAVRAPKESVEYSDVQAKTGIDMLTPFREYDARDFAVAEGRACLDASSLKTWFPVVYRDAIYRNFARNVSVL